MHSHPRGFTAIAVLAGLITTTAALAVPAARRAAAASPATAPAYRGDFDVTTIRSTGRPTNRFDIVIQGDGFARDDIQDAFAPVADRIADCYLTPAAENRDPYLRYRNFFNVHRVDAISNESGIDQYGIERDTVRSDGSYDERSLIATESAQRAGVDIDGRIASDGYGRWAAPGKWAETYDMCELILHESGHAFYGFADEYQTQNSNWLCQSEPVAPNITLNGDPATVKWRAWLGHDRPDDGQGPIGVFSPINGCLFRPLAGVDNSRMWARGGFTAVDREQIIAAIYQAVDPMDSYVPTGRALTDPRLWVKVVDPAVIRLRWTVYDAAQRVVAQRVGSPMLDTTALGLATGAYRVEAFAYDEAIEHPYSDRSGATSAGAVVTMPHPLDLVRDPALLAAMEQRVSWAVSITSGKSQAVEDPISSQELVVDRTAATGSTLGWVSKVTPGSNYAVSGVPGLGVDATGRLFVQSGEAIAQLPIGAQQATVNYFDSTIGTYQFLPISVTVVDHSLNRIDDDFGDGKAGIDRNGGRGFRIVAPSDPNTVVSESGGYLHLVTKPSQYSIVRSDETVDIRRGGGIVTTWTVRPPVIGNGGVVRLGLIDHTLGARDPSDLRAHDTYGGLRIELTSTSLSVVATRDGFFGTLATVPNPLKATDLSRILQLTATPGAFSLSVDGRLVAAGKLPHEMLDAQPDDDGAWGRRTQTAIVEVAFGASIDVDRVVVRQLAEVVPGPIVTHRIGDQRQPVGLPYQLDLSRFVDDSDARKVAFAATGLPTGLGLVDGQLRGTPSVAATWLVTVTATAADQQRASLSFTLVTVGSASGTVGPPPPTVRWRLDGDSIETEGTIGGDTWARSSYPTGSPTFQTGMNGSALVSSENGGFALRTHERLYTGAASTTALWVKPTGRGGKPSVILSRTFFKNRYRVNVTPTTGDGVVVGVEMTVEGQSNAVPDPQVVAALSAVVNDFYDGRWHHIVTVFDGQRLAVYVDGTLRSTTAALGPATTYSRTSGDILIGSATEAPFNGLVDDIEIWDSGLSSAAVAALAQRT